MLQKIKIIFSAPKPGRFIASRLLWRTGLCRYFLIKRSGFVLRFFPSSLSAAYWIDPEDRHEDEAVISRYLGPGDTYVDVGANIGALALCASTIVGRKGQVVAIEPHPKTYGFLAENIALNQRNNVQCLSAAVGKERGTLHIADFARQDDQNCVTASGISVPVLPLDEILRGISRIDLLKIDVEGYELAVLEGAREVLARTDAVLFEIWRTHLMKYGHTVGQILSLLREAGFRMVFPADMSSVPESFTASRCVNLLALRT